ncbi:TRAP transporter small permease subunit [Pontibaca salina]|uniref:TRAP transporter small permease protein n=1 Tax=Pontibaca salina TaxID=2795731 RepID=A0A934HPM9_9RHOB|nr:TRAP transporter small permease subunit [Pontibaca salina]MBI6630886.1 TRAP transporter small permease subunit [Pontibaca salina]
MIGRISAVLGYIGALILLPLIFASVYEVVARYVFGRPTIWAYEIGYMAMGASFLLGAAYTLRDDRHVRIDVIALRLSPKTRAGLDLISYLVLFLPIACWLTWGLLQYTIEAYEWQERSGESAWNPVIWPYYSFFFIGFACLLLQGIAEILKNIQILLGRCAKV